MSLVATGTVRVSIDTDGMSDQRADTTLDKLGDEIPAMLESALRVVRTHVEQKVGAKWVDADDWLVIELEVE